LRIFARLRCGGRTRVGWVERSDTHHRAAEMVDGFRKGSTHPTAALRLRGGVRIAQQPVDFRSSSRARRPGLDSRVRGK
jgi:hypothetical protein